MSSPRVGTRAWAARSGGALSRREQLALARQATLAQIAGLPSELRASLGSGGADRSALVVRCDPPDSRLAREALGLARESHAAPLLRHSLRSWLWADLLAQRDGVDHDPELLYVACLLHDHGLTDAHRPAREARCFVVHGAEVAYAALRGRGAADDFAERVAEAIVLHMNGERAAREVLARLNEHRDGVPGAGRLAGVV